MNLHRLQDVLQNEPSFRYKQAREAIWVKLVSSWEEATNLPQDLRDKLKQELPLDIKALELDSKKGGVLKAGVSFSDGLAAEAVLMKHGNRNTVCVSSQIGCSLGCGFCLTGEMGFQRNLEADEILEQAVFFARRLKKENKRLNNAVFMGMGEPFLNYDEVMKAVRTLNQEMGIGARRISISTVGIVPGIRKLGGEPEQLNLAVSLHAPNNELRSSLMPVNRQYPIEKLLPAIREYIDKTHRKVMIEYLMLKNVNDSPAHAQELAALLQKNLPKTIVVNLISYNQTDRYQSSLLPDIKKFRNILERQGIAVVQRYKFGRDIKAACGQLAGK